MIKKLLWLWIFVLWFINFSFATVSQVWLLKNPSSVNSNYDIWFLRGGAVITDFLGTSKSIASFDLSRMLWWSTNWLPYVYLKSNSNSNILQWFFDRYYSCDYMTWLDSLPSNCQLWWMLDYSWNLNTERSIFKTFFSTITDDDYVYYNSIDSRYVGATLSYSINWLDICWSSNSIWKSICFRWVYCGASNSSYCNSYNYWTLINSQWLSDLTFGSVAYSWIGYAPWQAWYGGGSNIDWFSQWVVNPDLSWNVTFSTCTNSKALSYYNIQWYKKNLCYSSYWNNDDIYTSPWSVSDFALTWLDISEVWLDTAWYRRYWNTWTWLPYNDWFQYWRKSFEVYNTSYNTSWSVSNPFVWVPVSLFTLFGNVYSYWVAYTNQSIIEYCDLLLFTDPNDPYEWILGDLPCGYSAIDLLADTIWVHAESWQVVQWSSWEWILNRPWYHLDLWRNSWSVVSWTSSWLSYFGDWKTFINNSFNTLSNSFKFPDRSSNWIIPNYILVFMFALILFRFISH